MKTGKIRMNLYLTIALVALCVFLLPTTANAETYGDFEYTVSNGEATITDYTGSAADLTIPSALGGYPVTTLGDFAFAYCDSLETVNVPDSITTIDECAFNNCSNLTNVSLPDSIETIGMQAFFLNVAV